jgi:spermidine synthase
MRAVWFAFFFVSGACSLVYQVVWLRLAMAAFGVTTPMVSIVIATFMAGLALGSWAAGRLARRTAVGAAVPLRLYALAELVIALSGDGVPAGIELGRRLLAGATGVPWGSAAHYVVSGLCIAAVLLPFCAAMGATFPFAMWAIRRARLGGASRSFSFLYLANVLGATVGTLTSAFVLIEMVGLRRTALVAAGFNGLLAAAALVASLRATGPAGEADVEAVPAASGTRSGVPVRTLLFATGLASMGMEVVWVRQFTPYLGTVVYAFAIILALYLVSTFLGSAAYRRWSATSGGAVPPWIWPLLALAGLLPLVSTDPRLPMPQSMVGGALRVALGVGPLCATLGFLTPWLLDRWSGGRADRVGGAYALNIVGCILGPLVTGFALLPWLGERLTLVALAALLGACAIRAQRAPAEDAPGRRPGAGAWLAAVGAALLLVLLTRDYATIFPRRVVRRDHAATVIATGTGMGRRLVVNGQGMTKLTPSTKLMAHLPLAFLDRTPQRALVVCFGMGTTFRSLVSWGVDTTAVELIPSVPGLFGFFHEDGPELLRRPDARVVVDDGRRFLERTRDSFDVITIDPPPPIVAAGSSLLYTREFYALIRRRLAPGGVVQQWLPGGDRVVHASFTRALTESFPYVRAFGSVEDFGMHFLASDRPLPEHTAAELFARLPPAAARDLAEWGPAPTPEGSLAIVLERELQVPQLLGLAQTPALTDDRPYNEYYLLRDWRRKREAAARAPR